MGTHLGKKIAAIGPWQKPGKVQDTDVSEWLKGHKNKGVSASSGTPLRKLDLEERLKDGAQFQGQSHIPFDLKFSGHEGHLRVQFALDNVRKIRGANHHRAFCGRIGSRSDLSARLSEIQNPTSPAVSGDIELVDRIETSDLVGPDLKPFGNFFFKNLFWC